MITTQANAYRLHKLESVQWPEMPKPFFHLTATVNKGVKGYEKKYYVGIKKGKRKTPYLTTIFTDQRIVTASSNAEAESFIEQLESRFPKYFPKGFLKVSKEY